MVGKGLFMFLRRLHLRRFALLALGVLGLTSTFILSGAEQPALGVHIAGSTAEARERARLLHLSFSDTLRVVHRDFFRRSEKLPFPSQSLSEVFDGLATNRNIRLRWIAAEETAMNLDHLPKDEFERAALRTLTSGGKEYEAVEPGVFRYAGVVVLENKCLKCHLQNRTTLVDRMAGLSITVPMENR
jgi:hypothetical protein